MPQTESLHLIFGTLQCCTIHTVQVILAGTLTGLQGDIQCKVLEALSTVRY